MPGFIAPTEQEPSAALGGPDDRVQLVLGGEELIVAEQYEVRVSILQQPGVFSIRLGHGGLVKDILDKCPPNTPFRLFIGGTLQMTGFTDGFDVNEDAGASEVTVVGRDLLAPLHDAFILADTVLTAKTYSDMVQFALLKAGVRDTLVYQDQPNRKATTGVSVIFTTPENESEEEATDSGTPGIQYRATRAKLGERWSHFVERQLRLAGLFLWAGADGTVILARPNANQKPVAKLVRGRNKSDGKNIVNVERSNWKNHTTPRFSEVAVYGRYGGKKYGPAKAKGHYFDPEMGGFGYDRPLVVHENNVSNERQAAFLASRKLAETRRAGWQLEYTVAGHSGPAIGHKRACWSPNTVVEVDDDEYGIHGPHWVESVTFSRAPTLTRLTLMRPSDVLFGEIE